MKLSIFTTLTSPESRKDTHQEAIESYINLADELIEVNGGTPTANFGDYDLLIVNYHWPKEFNWPFIGQQFQRGYEACTGDWVIRMDLDMLFHENDYEAIRKALETHSDAPAVSFYKYQFIQPDRYNIKSRLVLAANKGKYGDRIRFDGGGDLCQMTLDGQYLRPDDVPESGIAVWNYECLLKTKAQLLEDKGRFARAWQRHFGEYKLGGPDDESAYSEWLKMVVGRNSKPQKHIPLEDHPKVIQDTLRELHPDQFGYNGLSNFEVNVYAS